MSQQHTSRTAESVQFSQTQPPSDTGQSVQGGQQAGQPTTGQGGQQYANAQGPTQTGGRQPQSAGTAGGQTSGSLEGREFPTRTYLPEQARRESIRRLNRALADTVVLLTQTRYAHWNVRGPQFYQLHELFEDLAEELEDHTDLIGERITALGGQALGAARMATENSRVQPLPRSTVDGMTLLDLLADRLAVHDANLFRGVEAATHAGDIDTADLLNEISRTVGTYLWFMEAHFGEQGTAGGGNQGMQSGVQTQAQSMRGGAQARTTSSSGGGQAGGGAEGSWDWRQDFQARQ